ncbi:hypothetical protein LTR95_000604 [Oleoguttula sp. CCFEE 5521]
MRRTGVLWEAVAMDPVTFARFGKRLEDSEKFFDPIHYAIAQVNANDCDPTLELPISWSCISGLLIDGWEHPDDTIAKFEGQLETLDRKFKDLEEYCMSLQARNRRDAGKVEALAQTFLSQWIVATLNDSFEYGSFHCGTYGTTGRMLNRMQFLHDLSDQDKSPLAK